MLAATLAASVTGGAALLAPASAQTRAQANHAPTGAAAAGAAAAGVLLINGDHALVSSAGRRQITGILPAPGSSGLAGAISTLRIGGHTFLIPVAAMPFLGHGLDPSLFEASALRQAEHAGRLPVTIHYQGTLRRLPGITVTRRGLGTAEGYLTASSAREFAAALNRQMSADHARDSYGRDGLFAGGLTIGLPGSPAAAPAQRPRPRFPMHTLTVHGTNLAGQPDTGDEVTVWDVTDLARFGDRNENFSSFYHGTARFSVPAGTYWAFGLFSSPSQPSLRLDILPQFTVRTSTSVAISERAATSKVTFVTPRPAIDAGATTFAIVRSGSHGGVSWSWGPAPKGSLWINPVSHPATAGLMQTATSTQLVSPPGAATPYAYALDFPAPPGIIPPQRFVVRPADLATVDERYYQDVSQNGQWLSYGGTPSQFQTLGVRGTSTAVRLPGTQNLYLSARPAMLWQTLYFAAGAAAPQRNAWRLYHGGQHLPEAWNAYPLHPAPNVSLPGSVINALTSASRTANTLLLDITPFSDSTFGHTGSGLRASGASGSYAVYQNGTKIAGGNAPPGFFGDLFVHATLGTAPAQIRFVLAASHKGGGANLSPASQDVWTWATRPDPTATVPAPWYCEASLVNGHVQFDRHCAVQDMLTLSYQLAGLSLGGSTQPGNQTLGVTVGRLQLATASAVTHAAVQVSYDKGATWHPATLTRTGPGQFQATYTAPAATGVSLRVCARDAQGAAVTETLLDAYRTSG
jgi:hypothetical protein